LQEEVEAGEEQEEELSCGLTLEALLVEGNGEGD
jgi:hypothetical protein